MIKTLVLFILMMGIIIFIHEFGHLMMAKIFNVYVSEYSVGMGPLICSKQYKETKYSLRLLPLGGYCAIAGDNDNSLEPSVETETLPPERTLKGIAKWKKILILLGGIFMNLVLAWVVYSMVLLNVGSYTVLTKPVISSISEGYPAAESGLEEGDLIKNISMENGSLSIEPDNYVEVISFFELYDGEGPWTFTVERDGETKVIEVTPQYYEEDDSYYVGITLSNESVKDVKINFFNCFYYSLDYMKMLLKLLGSSLKSILLPSGIKNLSGPVGIYQTVEETAELGFIYYIELIGLISLNVGVFNALPLPIFDGGRVLLTLIEAVIGKPIDKKVENIIMTASMALLLILFVTVTYSDISKLIS